MRARVVRMSTYHENNDLNSTYKRPMQVNAGVSTGIRFFWSRGNRKKPKCSPSRGPEKQYSRVHWQKNSTARLKNSTDVLALSARFSGRVAQQAGVAP